MSKLTYQVTLFNGFQFTFSAYSAEMQCGPSFYCKDRLGIDTLAISHVSLVDDCDNTTDEEFDIQQDHWLPS